MAEKLSLGGLKIASGNNIPGGDGLGEVLKKAKSLLLSKRGSSSSKGGSSLFKKSFKGSLGGFSRGVEAFSGLIGIFSS